MRLRWLIATLIVIGLAGGLISGILAGPSQVQAAVREGVGGASAAPGSAQDARPPVLVLHVYFRDMAERDQLATELAAEEASTTGGYLTVVADQATQDRLIAQGLRVEVDAAGTKQLNNPNLFGAGSPDTFYGGYRTVEEMQAFLDLMVATYPTLAEKVDIGDSWCKTHPGACIAPAPTWNGFDLVVLHITNRNIAGPKPVFWYDAGIHSREIATPEMAMRYISYLLDNYNTNADAHWIVDYQDIWVMPMLNPDGHHMVESGGNSPTFQRKNGDRDDGCTTWPPGGNQLGTDINRNFPFVWGCCGGSSSAPCSEAYRGPAQNSEEETQAVVNQVLALIPDQRGPNNNDPAPLTTTGTLINMHSNAQQNLYPWGWTSAYAPNRDDLRNIGAHMSAPNVEPPGNGYEYCQNTECLYIVDGDEKNWGYGVLGIPSYSLEVSGNDFFPPFSFLDTIWTENRGALIYHAKIARTPYLLTHGPDANTVAVSPSLVEQGTPAQLTASINYAWTGNAFAQNVAEAEYYIDTPPWAGGTAIPLTGSFTGQTVAVQGTVSTGALSIGRHILFVRGRGVNAYGGFPTWGPISAVFLDVVPVGGITPSPTATPLAPSATATTVPTNTPTTVPPTIVASATPTLAPVVTPTPPCTLAFADVPTGYTFYPYIQWMVCRGYISGYPCGGASEPCNPTQDPYFRPGNNVTRGQVLKMAVNAAGWAIFTPFAPTFADVAESDPFYQYIETGAAHQIISGYPCGSAGEPCVAPGNRPYFRANTAVTRGQLSKVIALAKGYVLPTPTAATFADVPVGSTFFSYVEAVYLNGIVTGYPCGGVGEPCPGAYFRPGNNATRGQVTKFVTIAYGGP